MPGTMPSSSTLKVAGLVTSLMVRSPLTSNSSSLTGLTEVDTNFGARDAHLKSPDFFEVENHPTLNFRSTSITGAGDDLTIAGELTIKGVTKPITLRGELSQTVIDPWGNQRTSLAVTGKLSRAEFGLTWNMALEFGGLMVSDEVKLHVEAEAVAMVPVAA